MKPITTLLLGALLLVAPALRAQEPTPAEIAPSYLIEAIRLKGNKKTKDFILRQALGLEPGQRLAADDPRFEIARYRLLSLGYFSEVRLHLEKGVSRGQAVLVVEVEERGTILLTDLYLGTSEATSAWGGIGMAENNFLGRGISLEGAFVLGADPEVTRGDLQQSYRLRLRSRQLGGAPLSLSTSFFFLDGSDFFRRSGLDSSADPADFLSIRYRRIGGELGVGFDLLRYTRVYVSGRGEVIDADIPTGAVRRLPGGQGDPIPFGVDDGLSVLTRLGVGVERDTRNEPVLPSSGALLTVSAELATGLLGAAYDYAKLSASYQVYFPVRWQHVISLQLLGGVIFGEAPFFERFFIGDYNDLVPGRALGLNFSTLPSRDVFGTNIDAKRYEEIALRTAVEYIIPWFRSGKLIYGGDFFVNIGLIALTSRDALRVRDAALAQSIPVDLTLDAGLRLDTHIGTFRLSIGNGLARIPF